MPHHRNRTHCEQLSQFETGCIIGLKESGWENWRIARHIGQIDAAIRRCWQKWMSNSRFQRHDSSGLPRSIADREDRLVIRSAVTAPD
ncbi:HTH_Tnp_Tc3_2 domain-containing protein [Trichonephila clavipes]|nr:HTH_Tnp_Tc3_2 domain-containing protein [Trichonephila clavipes]